jgi:hypothetical protein
MLLLPSKLNGMHVLFVFKTTHQSDANCPRVRVFIFLFFEMGNKMKPLRLPILYRVIQKHAHRISLPQVLLKLKHWYGNQADFAAVKRTFVSWMEVCQVATFLLASLPYQWFSVNKTCTRRSLSQVLRLLNPSVEHCRLIEVFETVLCATNFLFD